MLRYCVFSCAFTHTSCLCVPWYFQTCAMLHYCVVSCTFTHASRYTTVGSLALPHICHDSLVCVLLHFHKRHACVFLALSHASCYATVAKNHHRQRLQQTWQKLWLVEAQKRQTFARRTGIKKWQFHSGKTHKETLPQKMKHEFDEGNWKHAKLTQWWTLDEW